jgi:hypothetical protein
MITLDRMWFSTNSECDDLPQQIIKFLKDIAHCLCYFKRNKNDGFTSIFSEYICYLPAGRSG